ncbi:hypothetical protein CLF_113168, partial [Clonorchis sinensis]
QLQQQKPKLLFEDVQLLTPFSSFSLSTLSRFIAKIIKNKTEDDTQEPSELAAVTIPPTFIRSSRKLYSLVLKDGLVIQVTSRTRSQNGAPPVVPEKHLYDSLTQAGRRLQGPADDSGTEVISEWLMVGGKLPHVHPTVSCIRGYIDIPGLHAAPYSAPHKCFNTGKCSLTSRRSYDLERRLDENKDFGVKKLLNSPSADEPKGNYPNQTVGTVGIVSTSEYDVAKMSINHRSKPFQMPFNQGLESDIVVVTSHFMYDIKYNTEDIKSDFMAAVMKWSKARSTLFRILCYVTRTAVKGCRSPLKLRPVNGANQYGKALEAIHSCVIPTKNFQQCASRGANTLLSESTSRGHVLNESSSGDFGDGAACGRLVKSSTVDQQNRPISLAGRNPNKMNHAVSTPYTMEGNTGNIQTFVKTSTVCIDRSRAKGAKINSHIYWFHQLLTYKTQKTHIRSKIKTEGSGNLRLPLHLESERFVCAPSHSLALGPHPLGICITTDNAIITEPSLLYIIFIFECELCDSECWQDQQWYNEHSKQTRFHKLSWSDDGDSESHVKFLKFVDVSPHERCSSSLFEKICKLAAQPSGQINKHLFIWQCVLLFRVDGS